MPGHIAAESEDGVCTLRIENPGKRNAVDYAMLRELIDRLDALSGREDHTVVVLRGAGEAAFSAGFDLTVDRTDRTDAEAELWPRAADRLATYEFPTIAMLNGDAYGGAVELAAACDLRVGVEGARIAITPAKLGITYRGEAIRRVMRLVGPAHAKELLFTGEPIDAATAERIGFLNHCVSRDRLADRTADLAGTIAGNAPLSLVAMKEICRTIDRKTELTPAERRWVRRVRDDLYDTADHEEGVAAFSEGREPEFRGE